MKRFILFLLAGILIPHFSFSQIQLTATGIKKIQIQTIDTAAIQISYELEFIQDTLKPDKKNKDLVILEIGETGISKYYSNFVRQRDSLVAVYVQQGMAGINALQNNSMLRDGAGDECVIFKNYPDGKTTVTDQVMLTSFLYEDDLNAMQWQILPDTMTLMSYVCQKATTHFRGRDYEAWFAMDLPINNGPWKFQGLPGLILRAKDSKNNFLFTCVGITKERVPITYPKKEFATSSRSNVNKLKRKFHEDPLEYAKSTFPQLANMDLANMQVKDKDGMTVSAKDIKTPFNPMELD